MIRCVRSLCELLLVLSQHSHSDQSIQFLEDQLKTFYEYKAVFRPFRMTKGPKKRFDKRWSDIQRKKENSRKSWSEKQKAAAKEKLEKEIYNFGFPKMHLPSHLAQAIRQMGSPDNFTTDISELLHVDMVKTAYRKSNRVAYEEQILFHNDRLTSMVYMIQTLEYLALNGYFDKDSARVLGLQSKEGKY